MDLKKQNVLFFTRTMNVGGTERVVLQLCKILKPYVNNIVVCSCGGVYTETLKSMDISHYILPDIENKSPQIIYKVFRTVWGIIDKEHITIVHTHHRMAAFYTAIISDFKKIIYINTAHNTFFDKKILTKFAYKKARLIACGENVKYNLVNEFELPEKNITVIHNAVEQFVDNGLIIEELNALKAQGYILVGNVGRLSEQKGIEYFIHSLPLVKKELKNVKYIVVGDGEDKQKLMYLTKKLEMEEDIIFLGYRNDIQNVMKHLDFIVLSSLWEGFPLTPIEAFSVKKTIIATKIGGTSEIVIDGLNGFLVEERNAERIANKVIYLSKNLDICKRMAGEAYKSYINNFSMECFGDKILQFYSKF